MLFVSTFRMVRVRSMTNVLHLYANMQQKISLPPLFSLIPGGPQSVREIFAIHWISTKDRRSFFLLPITRPKKIFHSFTSIMMDLDRTLSKPTLFSSTMENSPLISFASRKTETLWLPPPETGESDEAA